MSGEVQQALVEEGEGVIMYQDNFGCIPTYNTQESLLCHLCNFGRRWQSALYDNREH